MKFFMTFQFNPSYLKKRCHLKNFKMASLTAILDIRLQTVWQFSIANVSKHRFRETKNFSVQLLIFSYPSILTYVLGAQKNRPLLIPLA